MAIRWMLQNFTIEKSTSIHVMVDTVRQLANVWTNLDQSFMPPYSVASEFTVSLPGTSANI